MDFPLLLDGVMMSTRVRLDGVMKSPLHHVHALTSDMRMTCLIHAMSTIKSDTLLDGLGRTAMIGEWTEVGW